MRPRWLDCTDAVFKCAVDDCRGMPDHEVDRKAEAFERVAVCVSFTETLRHTPGIVEITVDNFAFCECVANLERRAVVHRYTTEIIKISDYIIRSVYHV